MKKLFLIATVFFTVLSSYSSVEASQVESKASISLYESNENGIEESESADPNTDDNYSNGDNGKERTVPKTGEGLKTILYLWLSIISVVSLIILMVKDRKRRQAKKVNPLL